MDDLIVSWRHVSVEIDYCWQLERKWQYLADVIDLKVQSNKGILTLQQNFLNQAKVNVPLIIDRIADHKSAYILWRMTAHILVYFFVNRLL